MEALLIPRIIKGCRILDLGANACHWPAKYMAWGASGVSAIEGRKEFLETYMWLCQNTNLLSGVRFKVSDVRDVVPERGFEILSALGLIYHLKEPWPLLRRLYDQSGAQAAIVEAQIYPVCWDNVEKASNGTMALEDGDTCRDTRDAHMAAAKACGFELVSEVSGVWWGLQNVQVIQDVRTGEEFCLYSTRALWILHVPPKGGMPWANIPGVSLRKESR